MAEYNVIIAPYYSEPMLKKYTDAAEMIKDIASHYNTDTHIFIIEGGERVKLINKRKSIYLRFPNGTESLVKKSEEEDEQEVSSMNVE